jgi:hypothetical protein
MVNVDTVSVLFVGTRVRKMMCQGWNICGCLLNSGGRLRRWSTESCWKLVWGLGGVPLRTVRIHGVPWWTLVLGLRLITLIIIVSLLSKGIRLGNMDLADAWNKALALNEIWGALQNIIAFQPTKDILLRNMISVAVLKTGLVLTGM